MDFIFPPCRTYIFYIILITLLLISPFLLGQSIEQTEQIKSKTNVEELVQLEENFAQESEIKRREAIQIANEKNWPIRREFDNGRVIELQFINESGKPFYYSTNNINASKSASTDKVWGGVYNLDGTGILLREWDGGAVRTTHQEFGGRVTIKDGTPLVTKKAFIIFILKKYYNICSKS